jgi:GAF domain-containing protein
MRRAETHRDNLKKLCQRMIVEFDTNVAFITAILDEYIWFISATTLEDGIVGELGAEGGEACNSLCQYVVATDGPLLVDDYNDIPWIFDVPGTKEIGVVSYMGIPWCYNGIAIGSVCVLDREPRHWTPDNENRLKEYGDVVESVIKI